MTLEFKFAQLNWLRLNLDHALLSSCTLDMHCRARIEVGRSRGNFLASFINGHYLVM
jgi:hypothetical protein